ncbi:DHA2 family efflux MFS transporter permease subunit [Kaistia dalseonensis]|uniref:DHA2 family multidrug resistance protein n=1 Tax=Kaistia dalseonensis TaxID=410840 RepID=A0ABU0H7P1_9HYPH|nr:DHA2 family efflux MFS transporter permease subunit [Kaistia dalseonensis]MCX5495453.1 DHA2 family efflux MFS transporter permease subunit [Kaistia dalseonensis]MDQ0438042.1 DHA2 family multidrug resistance protein [Kaistia dalseonensis]
MTPRRMLGFVAMCVGMFMAILDIQIVSSSLSEIQAGISASATEIAWVQTAYLIAEIVMIPLSGFLGRALSTRYLFAIAAGGFTITSIGCATSGSIGEIIVWRAVQGFVGGGMIPAVFAAAFTIFPKNRQAMVSAVVGLIATMAPTVGPTIGGYLTNLFSWHWLFLVNVIPGIFVTIGVLSFVDWDRPNLKLLNQFDFIGLITLAAFLGSLEYVLEEGSANDWFQDTAIASLAVVTVIAGIGFFWRVLTAKEPIVDVRAFKDRNFATGSLFSFMLGVGLYGLVYLYPVYLARVRSYDSLQIGETMFVTGLFMMITAPIAGNIAQRVDPRAMMAFGLSLFAVSCLELVPITKDWAFSELFLPQAMRGVALMTCMIPVSMLALGTLPPERIKNASGLFNLTRNLGGAVGLAVITTVLNNRWDLHIMRLHESVQWGRDAATERLTAMTQGFYAALGSNAELAALKTLSLSVKREALVMAFSDVFLLLAVMFAAIVLLVPLARKPAARGAAGGGGGH